LPLLGRHSIVFVDDNRGGIGKGMYVHDFMLQIGARVVHDAYQIGFTIP
jgi:hypothetical protein